MARTLISLMLLFIDDSHQLAPRKVYPEIRKIALGLSDQD